MTYDEAVEYIHSVSWKGSVPGLSRITEPVSYTHLTLPTIAIV